MEKIIVIVEDEKDICKLISVNLKKEGFTTEEFYDAESFYKYLKYKTPSLIILDIMLPDENGLDVCRYLKNEKKFSNIPIIMLTAKAEEVDKIIGLEIGADDYITKPFSVRELTARIRAVLRRKETKEEEDEFKIIKIGENLIIDMLKHEVKINNEKIDLTATEFKILSLLAKKKGWVYSREQILRHLWGNEKIVINRTVDVHIKHLREKLKKHSELIKNIRGVGYKIEE